MSKECKIENCSKPVVAKGYCNGHYKKLQRYGDPSYKNCKGIGNGGLKIEFEIRNGCYEVTSHKIRKDSYPEMRIKGRTTKIHRHIYEQCFGVIPEGMLVRHRCDNRSCINPEHLELGTHQDNMDDMVSRSRQARGSRIRVSKLTESDVLKIKDMLSEGMSNRNIATQFSISVSAVSKIKRKKTWNHIVKETLPKVVAK